VKSKSLDYCHAPNYNVDYERKQTLMPSIKKNGREAVTKTRGKGERQENEVARLSTLSPPHYETLVAVHVLY